MSDNIKKFWGQGNQNTTGKFKLNEKDVFALNLENLESEAYLGRIYTSFSSGSTLAKQDDQDSHTLQPPSEGCFLTPDISEDIILYGDNTELGCELFKKRIISDKIWKKRYHEFDNSSHHHQLEVFQYVSDLIVAAFDDKRKMLETIKPTADTDSKGVTTISSTGNDKPTSLMTITLKITLKALERQSRSKLDIFTVESIMDLFLQATKSSDPLATTVNVISLNIANKVSINDMLSKPIIESLRSVLLTGLTLTKYDKLFVKTDICIKEDKFRLAMCCAYSLLIVGLSTKNSEDIYIALAHLMYLTMIASEWKLLRSRNVCSPGIMIEGTHSISMNPSVEASNEVTAADEMNKSERSSYQPINLAAPGSVGKDKKKIASGQVPKPHSSSIPKPLPKRPLHATTHLHSPQTPQQAISHEGPVLSKTLPNLSVSKSPVQTHSKTSAKRMNSPTVPLNQSKATSDPSSIAIAPVVYPVKIESSAFKSDMKSPGGLVASALEQIEKRKAVESIRTSHSDGIASTQFSSIISTSSSSSNLVLNIPPPLPITTFNASGFSDGYSPSPDPRLFSAGSALPSEAMSLFQNLVRVPKSILSCLNDRLGSFKGYQKTQADIPLPTSVEKLNSLAGVQTTIESSAQVNPTASAMSVPPKHYSDSKVHVWSCGQNSYGELGHGDMNARKVFQQIEYFNGLGVQSIGAGNEHSVFVSANGSVYVAGYNENGQCGLGHSLQVKLPVLMSSLDAYSEDISSVYIHNGSEHTILVSKEGKAYSFGFNYRGQLGHGHTSSESIPRLLKSLLSKRVVKAACSYHHSLILCSDGSLYSFGRNDAGQLGHGDTFDKKTPYLVVSAPKDIVSIACGQFHSVLSTELGRIYVCGKNDYGQLGFESTDPVKSFTAVDITVEKSSSPADTSVTTPVVLQAVSGYYHTFVLLSDGSVYGTGRNDYGQLGLVHTQAKVMGFQLVTSLLNKGITFLACGCYHSIAATMNGLVYVFGRNNHGQLGVGDSTERSTPYVVDTFVGKKIVSVAAGFYHTLVLTADSDDIQLDDFESRKNRRHRGKLTVSQESFEDLVMVSSRALKSTSKSEYQSMLSSYRFPRMNQQGSPNLSRHSTGNVTPVPFNETGTLSTLPTGVSDYVARQLSNNNSVSSADSVHEAEVAFSFSLLSSQISVKDMLSAFIQRLPHLVFHRKEENTINVQSFIRYFSSVSMILKSCRLRLMRILTAADTKIFPLSRDDSISLLLETIQACDVMFAYQSETIGNLYTDVNLKKRCCENDTTNMFEDLVGDSEISLTDCSLNILKTTSVPVDTTENEKPDSTVLLKSLHTLHKEIFQLYISTSKLILAPQRASLSSATTTMSPRLHTFDKIEDLSILSSLLLAKHFDLLFPVARSKYKFLSMLNDMITTSAITEDSIPKTINPIKENVGTPAVEELDSDEQPQHRIHNKSPEKLPIQSAEVINPKSTEIRPTSPDTTPSTDHIYLQLFSKICESQFCRADPVLRLLAQSSFATTNIMKVIFSVFEKLHSFTTLSTGISPRKMYRINSVLEQSTRTLIKTVTPVLCKSEFINLGTETNVTHIFREFIDSVFTVAIASIKSSNEGNNFSSYGNVLSSVIPTLFMTLLAQNNSDVIEEYLAKASKEILLLLQSFSASTSNSQNSNTQNSMSLRNPFSVRPPHMTSASGRDPVASGTSKPLPTWVIRLLKLCLFVTSKLARRYLSTTTSNASLKDESFSQEVANQSVWKYLYPASLPTPSMSDLKILFESRIASNDNAIGTLSDSSSHLILKSSDISLLRDAYMNSDSTYKVLFKSMSIPSAASNKLYIEQIETVLLSCMYNFEGRNTFDRLLTSIRQKGSIDKNCLLFLQFSEIASVVKMLIGKRSQLMSQTQVSLSWTEILCLVYKLSCELHSIVTSTSYVYSPQSMLRPYQIDSKKTWKQKVMRVYMMITCVNRWKKYCASKMKSFGSAVTSLFQCAISAVTHSYTQISSEVCIDGIFSIKQAIQSSLSSQNKQLKGIAQFTHLLNNSEYNSSKILVLRDLAFSLRERAFMNAESSGQSIIDKFRLKSELRNFLSACFQNLQSITQIASTSSTESSVNSKLKVYLSNSDMQFIQSLITVLTLLLSSSHSMGFDSKDIIDIFFSVCGSYAALESCMQILGLIHDIIQSQTLSLPLPSSQVDLLAVAQPQVQVSKGMQMYERRELARKTGSEIVRFIQTVTIASQYRTWLHHRLLKLHKEMLQIFSSANNQHSLPTPATASTDASAGKKSCQDIITKPMEFSRSQDGHVIRDEFNHSSLEFSVCTWINVRKRPTSNRVGLIAGKIGLNDSWPLLLLRSDGKLSLVFGSTTEPDVMTSVSVLTTGTWVHIAVVVETKSIKVYINGIEDTQSATKDNHKAVNYPLIIGSIPASFNSQLDFAKESFDGRLAQFKYYTRALSPIHLKAISDQGPPDSYDVKERWVYQTIASLKVLVQSSIGIDSDMYLKTMNETALTLHRLFVTDTRPRIRYSSLQLVILLLTKTSSTISNTGDKLLPIRFPISGTETINQDEFRASTSRYLIRLLGVCWSPHILRLTVDQVTADGFEAAIVSICNQVGMSEPSPEELQLMLAEAPEFISFKSSSMTPVSDLCIDPEKSGLTSERRLELIQELSYHLIGAIQSLSRHDVWRELFSSACCEIISNVGVIVGINKTASNEPADKTAMKRQSWSFSSIIDALGAVFIVSESPGYPTIGADTLNYLTNHSNKVISLNANTKLMCLLHIDSASRELSVTGRVQLSLVSAKDCRPLTRLSQTLFQSPNLCFSVLQLISQLTPYAELMSLDLLSVYQPNNDFLVNNILPLQRPLEGFIAYKLMNIVDDMCSNNTFPLLFIYEHSDLLKSLWRLSTRLMSTDLLDEEISMSEASLVNLWQLCAPFLMHTIGDIADCSFPPVALHEAATDYMSSVFGICVETFESSEQKQLLNRGMLSELVQITSSSLSSLNNEAARESESSALFHTFYCEMLPANIWVQSEGEEESSVVSASDSLKFVYLLRERVIVIAKRIIYCLLKKKEFFVLSGFDILDCFPDLLLYLWRSMVSTSNCLHTMSALNGIPDQLSSSITWKSKIFETSEVDENSWCCDLVCNLESFRQHSSVNSVNNPVQIIFDRLKLCNQYGDVTLAIISAIRVCAFSLLQSCNKVSSAISTVDGSAIDSSTLLPDLFDVAVLWLYKHKNQSTEAEICHVYLKVLLPILSFIEHRNVEIMAMELCKFTISRLVQCISNGAPLTAAMVDLAKSNHYSIIRSRVQNQLRRQADSKKQLNRMTFDLTQVAAGLEIIQRNSQLARTSQGPITALNKIEIANTWQTPKPFVIATRQTSVDIDLSVCCAVWDFVKNGFSRDGDSSSELSFYELMIEVAVGIVEDRDNSVFETVYFGNSFRFVQSGLRPRSRYQFRCRLSGMLSPASERVVLGWSEPIDVTTEDSIGFHFDPFKSGPDIVISDDGASASFAGDDSWSSLLCTQSFASGITSWKMRITQSSSAYIFMGVARDSADLNTFLGGCGNSWGYIAEQALYHDREKVKLYGDLFTTGDVVGAMLDMDAGTLTFTKNGKNLGVAFENLMGDLYPAVSFYSLGQQIEIMNESFRTTCFSDSIPYSDSKFNLDEISLLSEIVNCLVYQNPLSTRVLEIILLQSNQWCDASLARYKTISGQHIFVSTSDPSLLSLHLSIGDRVRTAHGLAEVLGYGYGRVWFLYESTQSVWFVTPKQIARGQLVGYFTRTSYLANQDRHLSSAVNSSLSDDIEEDQGRRITDVSQLEALLDPCRWCHEMNLQLISFLNKNSESIGGSPWDIPCVTVSDDFRSIQQSLSRIVLSNDELSHKWGIGGPNRRAVVARLALLKLFNHLVQCYYTTQVTTLEIEPKNISFSSFDDNNSKLVTLSRNHQPAASNVSSASKTTQQESIDFCIQSEWFESKHQDLRSSQILLSTARSYVFPTLKSDHFWKVVAQTATRPIRTDDDYDYPEDLLQVKVNRLISFRAREASEYIGVDREDLIQSSLFHQLWCELRKEPIEKLCMAYAHPLDDGQARVFKIKFEGEGVDDYGGPYREIFQQVSDELHKLDPTCESMRKAVNSDSIVEPSGPSAVLKCFLPLLVPSQNWTCNLDCKEKYGFNLVSGQISPLQTDLYRFLGQFMGIAVRSKVTIDLYFCSYIWKAIVQEPLSEHDIASFDQQGYEFISQLSTLYRKWKVSQTVNATITESSRALTQEIESEINLLIEDLTWTCSAEDGRQVELIEGGAEKCVEFSQIESYIALYIKHKLCECAVAIEALRQGLFSVIPFYAMSIMSGDELYQIVCGSRSVDIARLKANTDYDDDISSTAKHISLFWEVLSEFSEAEKSMFLRFIWGRATLPPKDVEFPQRMKIQNAIIDTSTASPDSYLPKAHTCFFSMNLPKYSTKEIMHDKLLYAITNCTEMDADFRLTETDVVGWSMDL